MNLKRNFKYLNHELENGSALASVLIISSILILFIGGILYVYVVQHSFIQKDIDRIKANYLAEKQLYEFFYAKQHPKDLKEILQSLRLSVREQKHGLFDIIESRYKVNNRWSYLKALVGSNADQVLDYAIVLGDTNAALTLTGSPRIVGNIQAGSKGIRNDNFRGVPFSGKFKGKRIKPTGLFKKFSGIGTPLDSLIIEFNNQFTQSNNIEDRLLITKSIESKNFPVIPKNTKSIIIEGNLTINTPVFFPDFSTIIISDSLKISEKVVGDHLIFYARKLIELDDEAEVQGQFFSTQKIIIKESSYIKYPSIIATYFNPPNFNSHIPIFIDKGSIIDGLIITIHSSALGNKNEKLKNIIEEGAIVRGVYFNSGITEHKGKILGTLLTQNFQFYESPTSYINWIREGEIDLSLRPRKLAIPLSIGDTSAVEILDWRLINE
jgi:hypothetical protein